MPYQIKRVADDAIEVQVGQGLSLPLASTLYRSDRNPLKSGDQIEVEGMRVTVLDAVSKAVYRTLGTSGGSTAKGAQQVTFALPKGAPEWLVGPGTAFPPYPAW